MEAEHRARHPRASARGGVVILVMAVIAVVSSGVECVGDVEDVLGRAEVQVAHVGGGRAWEDMRAESESESGAAAVVVGSICGREGTQGAVLSFRIDSDGMKRGARFNEETSLRLKLRRYDAGAARVRVHEALVR